MKTPLIHNDVYKELIDIGRIYRQENNLQNDGIITGEGPSEVIILLRLAISKLSLHRLATLRHVMAHLHQVADQEEQNSMTPMALGIVFAPTLFRPR